MAWSSRWLVALGLPDLGRSCTVPVCRRRLDNSKIVFLLQLNVRLTSTADTPACNIPTARFLSASESLGIISSFNFCCVFVVAVHKLNCDTSADPLSDRMYPALGPRAKRHNVGLIEIDRKRVVRIVHTYCASIIQYTVRWTYACSALIKKLFKLIYRQVSFLAEYI